MVKGLRRAETQLRREEEQLSSPVTNQDNDIVALIYFFQSLKIEFEDTDSEGAECG